MFSAGDVVELQSGDGDTPMTVKGVDGEKVHCVWHTTTGNIREATFDACLLKPADEQKVSINIFMGGEKVER